MSELYLLLLLFFFGCLGGFFAGLLGIGGGLVFIPVLSYFFGKLGIVDPDLTKAIISNSFFAIIFSGISASYGQYKKGNFYPRQVLTTSVGAVVASLLMSWLISQGTWYNKISFTFIFIAVLILLNVRLYLKRHQEAKFQLRDYGSAKFIQAGVLAGAFAALSGLGGGFIMVMLFVQWLELDIKESTAISTGTIPFISIPLVIYYMIQQPQSYPVNTFHVGYILVYVMLPLIVGVLIVSPIGVKVAARSKPHTLKMVFIFFSIILVAKMLYEIL